MPRIAHSQMIQLALVLALAGTGLWVATHSASAAKEESSVEETAENCVTACALPTTDEELRALLTPEQYRIMKENGTELPFKNEYWDNHEEGIYVDRISGVPLFASTTKFDSGTGWPSFSAPLGDDVLNEIKDASHGMVRTEVRSLSSDSHLGHVFPDGPKPTGLRYCMNSASLRFIAVNDLETEGLGQYLTLFGLTPSAAISATPKAAPSEPRSEAAPTATREIADFAGGCFWGVEGTFQQLPGVIDAVSGYEGGHADNPTYKQVCASTTGHTETVQITYDPSQVSYERLLEVFFGMIDPTQVNRQGPDFGSQYRSVVFTRTPAQAEAAKAFVERLNASGKYSKPIATQVQTAEKFWPAEDYHQDYFKTHNIACHIPTAG